MTKGKPLKRNQRVCAAAAATGNVGKRGVKSRGHQGLRCDASLRCSWAILTFSNTDRAYVSASPCVRTVANFAWTAAISGGVRPDSSISAFFRVYSAFTRLPDSGTGCASSCAFFRRHAGFDRHTRGAGVERCRAVRSGCFEREQFEDAGGCLIPIRQRVHAEQLLQRLQNRRMIVVGVTDRAFRDQRRDDESGDAHAVQVKLEPVHVVAVIRVVAGRLGGHGSDGIVQAAVLVVGDDKEAGVPVGRVADRCVHGGQKMLAAIHVVHRMLGRPAAVGVVPDIAVVRLDERVRVGIGALQVGRKLPQRPNLSQLHAR